MTVSALKSFILSQGASKRIISMEWDKFWAENKKVLEESAHRYMSVSKDTCVPFTITNLPTEESIVSIPLHPQKPDMGTRVSRRFNKLLLDQEDVNTFVEGEEMIKLFDEQDKQISLEMNSPLCRYLISNGVRRYSLTNGREVRKALNAMIYNWRFDKDKKIYNKRLKYSRHRSLKFIHRYGVEWRLR